MVEVVDQLDVSKLTCQYAGRGSKAHHPATLLAILVYGYATGIFSSRKLELATYDSVAFRFIAAGTHPDHDTLATFRRRFLPEVQALFVQVLELAKEMTLLKLGAVCLDGTKIHANASRHSALSHGHIEKLEGQLEAGVAGLFALAEAADQTTVPDRMNLPEELERRQDRLAAMAIAKRKIEARAAERRAREQREYEQKVAARAAKQARTGKKPAGKPPQPPSPKATDQVNLTDEESRIMPVAGGGFEQAYNAQAAVDAMTMLVLRIGVTQAMARRLKTKAGRARDALRKQTVEPVFGIIKSVLGFRQFSLRGLTQVRGEWSLVCLAWNLKRMAGLRPKFG